MEHIGRLQFCNSMAKLDVDGYEYAYLKTIVLFSSSLQNFFADHIGSVSVDSIIPYILKMETAEYNGQISRASR
ncbi:Nuclear Receptor Subfamily 2 Group C Member 2 [Manis pentadactyla]|nr:Nuclear Receptor Subfamily 2 Group C Member 2 [Manis pentadactyla]